VHRSLAWSHQKPLDSESAQLVLLWACCQLAAAKALERESAKVLQLVLGMETAYLPAWVTQWAWGWE
jgi:hypothetical protein